MGTDGWSGWSLTIGKPWWLLALAVLLPLLIVFGWRSLAGLGRGRRLAAVLVRGLVVTLVILALAELQVVRTSDRLTTLFLLDTSQSIPQEWRERMLRFVSAASASQKPLDDLAGTIVFGSEARVETPPSLNPAAKLAIENTVDGENTDLAAAIKLALASFPQDTRRRLVVLSDGNDNRGDAAAQALAARGLDVPIDVLPIDYRYDREVLVEKVTVPPDVKPGETVNINVVIRASEPTTGALQIYQRSQGSSLPLAGGQPERVELRRGLNVLTLKQTITEPRFYTFSAEFIPDPDSGDERAVNNAAEGFTQAKGQARVLLIEGIAGEHAELVDALRSQMIEVDLRTAPRIDADGIIPGDPMPSNAAELQPYDCVILANVPKDAFTDVEMQLLERNTHDFGAGLIMLGGPQSFGAGGWMNTPVERALPVDMQIKSTKVVGKSALAMIMHASEIPEGNYWQKKVAQEALNTLSSYDYAGLLHWQGQEAWLFTLRPIGENKSRMLRTIDQMTPGDMPSFDPSLQLAIRGLRTATGAMSRHIIVISDGDPAPPTAAILRQLTSARITVTTVLVAAHGGDASALFTMQDLARRTKGRFYNVTNPKALPRIYQKEARLISRPLIYEQPDRPWSPNLVTVSEPVRGMPVPIPGITGLVQTSLKENELVEMPLVSPLPTGTGQVTPLLAHWTYGLGRAAAFTSDAGRRWSSGWTSGDDYTAFWTQLVRWAMRPVERGNLSMTLQREGDQIKVLVDALDTDSQFLNFLRFQGVVVNPDLEAAPVTLSQTAPGRYEGLIEGADARGNYFVTLGYIGPDGQRDTLRSGVSVPYSEEYRDLRSDPAALETIASLTGGRRLDWTFRDGRLDLERTLAQADVFRRDSSVPPPRRYTDLWPDLLWLACLLFLADVAVRRIAPDMARMRAALGRVWQRLRGQDAADTTEYIEKLKGKKAEVAEQIDRTRGATRFEPAAAPATGRRDPVVSELDPQRLAGRDPSPGPAPPPSIAPDAPTAIQPSYADRLMRAKKKVWEDRERPEPPSPPPSSDS